MNPYPPSPPNAPSGKRIAAGICGILLGCLGVHKFILGYNSEGIILLLLTMVGGVITCGVATYVTAIIGLIEGIVYLTKSDSEFDALYVYGRKPWF